MKRKILISILFFISITISSCNFAYTQQINTITSRCPSPNQLTSGSVRVWGIGDIVYTPCTGRASIFNGNVDFTNATIIGTGFVTGSGTANFVPRWTSATNLANTPFSWNGTTYVFNNTALNSQVIGNFTPALTGSFDIGDYTTSPTSYFRQNYNTNITSFRSSVTTQFNETTDAVSCKVSILTADFACRNAAGTNTFQFDATGTLNSVQTISTNFSSPFINLDSGIGATSIGDLAGAGSSTKIGLSDSTRTIAISADGSQAQLKLDGDFDQATIGDVAVTGGATYLQIDDSSNVFLFNNGTQAGIFNLQDILNFQLWRTITAGGTTGNQTINKPNGSVNIAGAGTSIVITNNTVTTSSTIIAVANTNDATCAVKNAVPTANTITITMTAACTAETRVAFWVFN